MITLIMQNKRKDKKFQQINEWLMWTSWDKEQFQGTCDPRSDLSVVNTDAQ